MEKNIRLSKKQERKTRKQVTNEELKKQRQDSESSSSSEGKIMIGPNEQQNPETKNQQITPKRNRKMKAKIVKYEEIFFNQGEKIRELRNYIEDQNNELLILKSQLIKNQLVTENQLYEMSQTNFTQSQRMIIEEDQYKIQLQEKQNQEKMIQTQVKELIYWRKKFIKNRNQKNDIKIVGTANLGITYQDIVRNEDNSSTMKNKGPEETQTNFGQLSKVYINRKYEQETKRTIRGSRPLQIKVVENNHGKKLVSRNLVENSGYANFNFTFSQDNIIRILVQSNYQNSIKKQSNKGYSFIILLQQIPESITMIDKVVIIPQQDSHAQL